MVSRFRSFGKVFVFVFCLIAMLLSCGGDGEGENPPSDDATGDDINHPIFNLTVASDEGGTVSGLGIHCGVDCTESYANGTQVALSASPGAGYLFSGWDGACSGTGGCMVTMDQPQSVSANFSEQGDNDCAEENVHCVDDTPGDTQEFDSIQAAADQVEAGQTIVVYAGHYAGFSLDTGGLSNLRIMVKTDDDQVIIDADGPSGYGIYLQNVSYVTIQGFHIEGVSGRGIAHRGATPTDPVYGLIIKNNTISDTAREGMYLSEVADSLVEANTITNSGHGDDDLTHGIYLANAGSDGTTIRGNHISYSGTAGIHFNGDESIGGDGIISNLIIEENVIFNNSQNGLNMDGVQDSIIRNNLIYNNARNGLRAYAIDASEGPTGLVIVNNTFYVSSSGDWCVRITEDEGTNFVFNNILMNDHAWKGSIALDDTVSFKSANNAVVNRFTPDRDDTILSLSEWQALGYDENSFIASTEQLFVSIGDFDFRLNALTVAEDKGVAQYEAHIAPETDLAGALRIGFPDLGAYEK